MNSNKKTPIIIAILVIVIALGIVWAQNSNKQKNQTKSDDSTVVIPSENSDTQNPTKPSSPSGYSLATVESHNSTSSCWTVINGNVYDVTSWINKHPGGKQAILGTCGKDASAYFNGQHGGQAQPISVLATFKIGALLK